MQCSLKKIEGLFKELYGIGYCVTPIDGMFVKELALLNNYERRVKALCRHLGMVTSRNE